MSHVTYAFTVRIPRVDEPGRLDIVKVPAGLLCTIAHPKRRRDSGKLLRDWYVEVTLADGRVFYTDQGNVRTVEAAAAASSALARLLSPKTGGAQ